MSGIAVTNVVFAGLGGQGVLKASDILADAAFAAGFDVKKAEIHGMSQRGGSVTSDVRFGEQVNSPMVPAGEADYLVVLSEEQVENNRHALKDAGVLIEPTAINVDDLENKRSLNVALLGVLSAHFDIAQAHWETAIRKNLKDKVHEVNLRAFAAGGEVRAAAKAQL